MVHATALYVLCQGVWFFVQVVCLTHKVRFSALGVPFERAKCCNLFEDFGACGVVWCISVSTVYVVYELRWKCKTCVSVTSCSSEIHLHTCTCWDIDWQKHCLGVGSLWNEYMSMNFGTLTHFSIYSTHHKSSCVQAVVFCRAICWQVER